MDKKTCQEKAVDKLKDWEEYLRQMWHDTDEMPHTVYTLMDADRMRCLYHNLKGIRDEVG